MAFPDPVTTIFLSAALGDRVFSVGCVAKTHHGLNSMPAARNRKPSQLPPSSHDKQRTIFPADSIIETSLSDKPPVDDHVPPSARLQFPIMSSRRVEVFGPAYLDRVLRVEGPILDPSLGPPLDQSTEGTWKFASARTIEITDPTGFTL